MERRTLFVSIPYKRVTNMGVPREKIELWHVSIPYKRVTNPERQGCLFSGYLGFNPL